MIQVNSSTTLADFYRQLSAVYPELFGNVITVQMAASTSPQKFEHGLGRAYRGAIIFYAGSLVRAADPAAQTDADTHVTLVSSTATAGALRARVF